MTKDDVVDRLGEPDAILPRQMMMTSFIWQCSHCQKVFYFAQPVTPPAPCFCGGIAFEKISRSIQ